VNASRFRNTNTDRFGTSTAAGRHARSSITRNIDTGRYETVELKTRGKTVKVSPAAAKVLRAAEDLRVSVSWLIVETTTTRSISPARPGNPPPQR